MIKLRKILFFTFAFFLCSCNKDKLPNSNLINEENQETINFDNVLKCSDYSYEEGYFVTADYGCIYNQKGNKYGNIIIYLLPKKELEVTDGQIENEDNIINKLSIDNYKKEFKIVLFLIENKYLNYNKFGDPVYYQKPLYEQKAYIYDDKYNKWVLIDSIKLLNEKENQKEQTWRESIISKQIERKLKDENSCIKDIPMFIQAQESKNFTLLEKKVCDLNNDNLEDFILVFENDREYDSSDIQAKIAPIIVLINNENGVYKKYENDYIYPNNFNDYYKKLVVKNQFFTIELSNEVPDKYSSNKYITFKYDYKNIVLHRYAEIVNWSDGKINNMNYSYKDFGIIKFSEYDSNTILEKINN